MTTPPAVIEELVAQRERLEAAKAAYEQGLAEWGAKIAAADRKRWAALARLWAAETEDAKRPLHSEVARLAVTEAEVIWQRDAFVRRSVEGIREIRAQIARLLQGLSS